MARKKKEECKQAPAWLTSFSDLMSLLLTFFILLYSMSTLDITKAIKFLSYFQGEKAKSFEQISIVKPVQIYTTDLAKKIKRLFNRVLFKENSVELTPKAKKALDQIAKILKELKGGYQVVVEGHTSEGEPTVPMEDIHDSWDLSLRRATAVVRYLVSKGVDPSKLEAVGYDSIRPLYTWNNPILQARNRRVEIYIKVAVPREGGEKKVEFKREEKLPGKSGQKSVNSEKR